MIFHDLITSVNSGDVWLHTRGKQQSSHLMDVFEKHSRRTVCFHMGNFNDLEGVKTDERFFKLPYPCCYFEVSFSNKKKPRESIIMGILIWRKSAKRHDQLTGECFMRHGVIHNQTWFYEGSFQIAFDEERQVISHVLHRPNDDFMYVPIGLVSRFVAVMKCNNVVVFKNTPNEKIQRTRKKKSLVPLFEYKTLHLKLSKLKKNKIPGGGSHASPRLHLRRCHVREYQPGRFTYVSECLVGDVHRGFVIKDYDLKE